jgi:hypothetical protein
MIRRLCYALYKVDWEYSHMITAERKMDSLKNYFEDEDYIQYSEYLEEYGYDGELYVCFEEFLDAEYQDEEYMCRLLDKENLIAMYLKDINTNN